MLTSFFKQSAQSRTVIGRAPETKDGRRILRIDASMRREGSASRAAADALVDALIAADPQSWASDAVIRRDLAEEPIPQVSEAWIGAAFTKPEERTAAQKAALAISDALIAELMSVDVIVIGTPIYNFGAPAALKAWIDQVARVGVTFRYSENGPVGLLEDKKAYVAIASGGTQVGSPIDFATPWLRHVLGFIGVHDVTSVGMSKGDRAELTDALAALRRAG